MTATLTGQKLLTKLAALKQQDSRYFRSLLAFSKTDQEKQNVKGHHDTKALHNMHKYTQTDLPIWKYV